MGKTPISFGHLIRLVNSAQNPTRSRILCFHTIYSNENILSFQYQNLAIQKPKFTFMNDSKFDKIVLKTKKWT
jgi:hypothetical protein